MYDKIYRKVPKDQKNRFLRFREIHPYKSLMVGNLNWKYISTGKAKDTIVLLPGGIRSAESWEKLITILEKDYRIISPTYPAIKSIDEGTKGLFEIISKENIKEVSLVGQSFGGWIAQAFTREHSGIVNNLILSNTSGSGSIISERMLKIAIFLITKYPLKILRYGMKTNYFKIFRVAKEDKEFWKAFITELFYFKVTKEEIINQYIASYDFLKNYQFKKEDLAKWAGKILIIESSDDVIRKNSQEELRSIYPNSFIHIFHRSGHTPGYTNALEYAKVLIEFLSNR
jgi:pimeloyl-ACP methyl ester carboxylesterase